VTLPADYLCHRPETNFNQFPNLKRITIRDLDEDQFPLLSGLAICDQITDVSLPWHACPSTLPHLPNLVSLSGCRLDNMPSIPLTLQELSCKSIRRPEPLICLTKLTTLAIMYPLAMDDGDMAFKVLTALTALQKLEISCSTSLISCLSDLALPTHLEWSSDDYDRGYAARPSVPAPLTRLQRLMHLGLQGVHLRPRDIRTLGKIASLQSLVLACI
jgi:hypothetical protein